MPGAASAKSSDLSVKAFMSNTYDERRWGDQRKMRAKAKVNIRRRDRKRLGKPTEESSVIEPVFKRNKAMRIK